MFLLVLDEVMAEKQISARRLSLLSGLSRTYINDLKSEQYINPTISVVARLAKALDVPIDKLVKYEGE